MPRVSRAKASSRQHATAIAVPSKRHFAVADDAVREVVLPGSGQDTTVKDLLAPIGSSSKQKKTNHSAADLVPPPAFHPYSRSHVKREKRKARQELHGGQLASVEAALSEVLGLPPPATSGEKQAPSAVKIRTKEERIAERLRVEHELREKGKIGLGKGKTLTEKARRAEISSAARRIPAVMKHPAFKTNPWAAIREHASNSIAIKDQSAIPKL